MLLNIITNVCKCTLSQDDLLLCALGLTNNTVNMLTTVSSNTGKCFLVMLSPNNTNNQTSLQDK